MKYTLKQGLRWYMLSMAVTASAQVSAPVASTQLPTGGKVMSGTTSIQSVGNVLNINQSSQRSAINWNTFNVGSGAKVNFIQPSASSVTLNRVLDTNGSQILGSINANGQVFISNPNGVLFGPNSQVNVGGLIATTQNISVDDFMAGKSSFEGTGAAGSVLNQGTLEAALGGYIALLAPSVRNEGVVLAREGTVAFAAGDKTVVQFNGPQLVSVMVDRSVLDALVENKQIVRADGGLVIFSARSANAVLSSVIRNTGTVQANTIVNRQGRIMLEGGSQGVVEVGGTLQASGVDAGTQGGTISATGDKVSVVSGALLDATGQAGGGNVLVGGGWQGSDPTIQSANAVNIASGAVLNASAIQNGKGGTLVAWSDTQNSAGVTKVQGTLFARGGVQGGDGGRIETSGRWISVKDAQGDARSFIGVSGQWLFDPYNVEIISSTSTPTSITTNNSDSNSPGIWVASGAASTILNTEITTLLNAGTSVATSTTGVGSDAGNITVNAPIERTIGNGAVNLTLTAHTNININNAITVTGSGSKLELNAGNSGTNGSITLSNTVKADTLSMNITGTGSVTQSAALETNNLRIYGESASVTLENTSNKVGVLAANVGSLSLKNASGIDLESIYGSGTYIGTVEGLSGVTSAGKIAISVESGNLFVEQNVAANTSGLATSPALKLSAGASFSVGSNSINAYNPFGPNIILTSGKTLTAGTGGTGLLYSGGFGNSGAQLATYLGANASRYNSNETTTNYATAIGTGLTAIYRQNPTLTVTAPNASVTYGSTPSIGANTVSGYFNSDTVGLAVSSAGTNTYTPSNSTSGRVKAGSYDITPSSASSPVGYGFTYTNGTLTVLPKSLSLTAGITAASKVYDGLTTATLSYSSPTYSGLESGDIVSLSSATGTFANKNVGTSKNVVISGASLSGTDASNYSFTNSQTTTTADISSKILAVTAEINSANKIYDTSRTASPTLVSNQVSGDSLAITYAQSLFDTKNVGTGKTVTVGGIAISGTDAANYTLQNTSTTTTSAISTKNIELSNVAVASKTYDASDIATVSGGTITTGSSTSSDKQVYSSDSVNLDTSNASGVFANANAGTAKSVTVSGYTLLGSDANNYSLSQPAGLTANISQKAVSILGISANNKIYDSTTTATLSGTSLTSGASTATDYKIYSSDVSLVTLDTSNSSGVFASKNAANGISVSASGFALSGTRASNYSLLQPTGLTANITQAQATVTADSATTTYTGATQSVSSFTASGLVANETSSVLSGITVTGTGKNAGTYPTVASGSDTNYAINFVNGSLVINKANATLTGLSASQAYDGKTYKLNGFTAAGLVGGETTSDLPNVSSTVSGRFSGTYVNTPQGSSDNYNLNFVSGKLVITGCVNGPPCVNMGPQLSQANMVSVATPITTASSTANTILATGTGTGSSSSAPVLTFTSSSVVTPAINVTRSPISNTSGGGTLTLANSNAPTNSVNTINAVNTPNIVSGQTTTPASQSPTNIAGAPTTIAATTQPAAGVVVANNNPNTTQVNVTATQPNNVVTPQRLADILSKKDPVEIATALPPTQVAQLSAEQVAPLVNSLNLRQLMSLTNEQIAKFEPARQAELLNIIKVLQDNPEKAAEKAFTPTDKTFAQLAANGLLKEQIDTLSTRVTQINQNRTTVNIDTPQKLAELLTKKDPVEIATGLPSNQVAQLTPEQAAPLINSLTLRQLLALTNEQISKLDPARQAELLNIINVIKNNPEKAADKAYTAIDKTTAQYATNGLMKDQIDALASRVTQLTQSKTTINIDTPQKLAAVLSKNTPVEVASALPSNIVPQLSPEQVAPLINSLSVKQLLSLTNEQMTKLDPARLAELLNIIKGLKDNPEKATDKTYTPEDAAVAKYAATGLLKDPIERLSLRANYIANNKSVDPLNKELADLTNPPVPANVPLARNTPNQANRPLNAAQLAAQNANRETPNLTPAQVAALDPKDLGPLLSQLNANQLMAITNLQMARLEGAYLNQLTTLLNFVQDRASITVANAGPTTAGNRVNNTNIFINQPVAKLAGAALLADQPNIATPTAPTPTPAAVIASVTLTPRQVSELDPAQLAPLINQLNANQLMAITNAQMARMDGRALNQLTILMNFVQQRTANNNGPANGNNPANGGNNTNINVFVNQPVSRLASNALLNEQPKTNEPLGNQSFTQTNITVNLTPRQVAELDPTQLAPLISQLNANQLMAITNTQMARMDSQAINQLNILMNFVQQRALNSNTNTTIYINQPVSRIAAASLMNDQPPPTQIAGAAPAAIATVPLSPQQIAGLTPSQVAPLLNRMNSRQLMAVTDTQMASLDSANLNQLITLLNFIQDSARTSPIVTNNFANRPVAGFLPPELNTTQTLTQP